MARFRGVTPFERCAASSCTPCLAKPYAKPKQNRANPNGTDSKAGKRSKPSDAAFTQANYIAHPGRIECSVAVDDDGALLGFQSLRLADASNPYGTPTGWGIIGTHISPMAARRGIGRALFDATLTAARNADLPAIEAFIGDTNQEGQAYYEAMGFRDWRDAEGAVCKAFRLS